MTFLLDKLASRYRRLSVFHEKCWKILRSANAKKKLNLNFCSRKWIKRLTCDVFHCVLVFQWIFRLNCVNSAVTPYERNESWSIIAIISDRILDQPNQMPFFRRNSNPLQLFSGPAQEGNLPFHSARSARKKLHHFPLKLSLLIL